MNTEKKIQKYLQKVEEFNKDLLAYYQESGENELPDIDSTLLGYSPMEPYKILAVGKNGFKVDADGMEIEVKATTDEDGEEYITGWDDGLDSLKESIAYDRRRLRKAWRIWKSNNPDEELEKDEE